MTHSQNSKNWIFLTRRIEPLFECLNELNPFVDWLKELNPVFFFFFNMTQRIELLKYDSKNWTLLPNTTHRIKDYFFNLTQRIECDSKHWILVFQLDSKNWTFFFSMTWRLELSFRNMSHRIKPFWKKKERWLEELIFRKISIKLKKHSLMIQRINWALFFRMTQRFCWIRLKESNFFFVNMTPRIDLFKKKNVLRIVLKYDSQNWTYFSALSLEWNIWEYDSKELIFYCNKTWHKELNLFLIWPKRLNFFLWYDPKDWIFLMWLKESNTFWMWVKELNLSSTWLKELNPQVQFDSKNWTLFTKGLKELDPKKIISKNVLLLFFDSCWKEVFNLYESIFSKRVQFCESCLRKGSILWVIFKKGSIIWSEIFEKSILWFKFEKKVKFSSSKKGSVPGVM